MRGDLPSGTVTFLFTDVEGSTQLLHELGAEAYADTLAEHRRLIREACARHGGVEVDTQGDALFVSFPTAPGALFAAGEATEALASGPIRVRIGLHSGTPLLTEEGYVGHDVHRAARLAASAHGGQVILSGATAEFVELKLTDLGEHRFKDLAAPERVYQLGKGDFPALKSLYRTNLPIPASSFLGRERELSELVALLTREEVRLITLTGPGGTGKTRLALQAAAEASDAFPDGVWWVALAPLRDPSLVLSAVAQALEVREEPSRELAELLVERLGGKKALLLLDNAEHLLPELASQLSPLVRDAGTPAWLVTSRERLQLQGEHAYAVPTLEEETGIALFLERAAAAGSPLEATEAVRELCLRLDNLPLALELAAARTVLFSPEQLVERLAQRLDLLKGGRDADPRQQTLRATIEWSYDLLSEAEQRLFRSLSVFVGGCTYEAADEVCRADPDTLQSLLDKSLLRRRIDRGEPRYWMLETIREYALKRLEESSGSQEVKEKHSEWFARLVERAEPELEGAGQDAWLDRLEDEHDNVRAALRSALDRTDSDLVLRLAGSSATFWWVRGHWSEGRRWLDEALSKAVLQDGALRAKALEGAAHLAARQLDYLRAKDRAEESLEIRRELNDASGTARSLRVLGLIASGEGDDEAFRVLIEESAAFARKSQDLWALSMALNNLGYLALEADDVEQAALLFEEALGLALEGGDQRSESFFLENLALAKLEQGMIEQARDDFAASLRLAHRLRFVEVAAEDLMGIGAVAAAGGGFEGAAQLVGGAQHLREQIGAGLDPVEARVQERTVAAIERSLGRENYEAASLSGRNLNLDELVNLALSITG